MMCWTVATREGGVDRNTFTLTSLFPNREVATREGGVDRNSKCVFERQPKIQVATREGGVDRNMNTSSNSLLSSLSPPARVAWIEITNADK